MQSDCRSFSTSSFLTPIRDNDFLKAPSPRRAVPGVFPTSPRGVPSHPRSRSLPQEQRVFSFCCFDVDDGKRLGFSDERKRASADHSLGSAFYPCLWLSHASGCLLGGHPLFVRNILLLICTAKGGGVLQVVEGGFLQLFLPTSTHDSH